MNDVDFLKHKDAGNSGRTTPSGVESFGDSPIPPAADATLAIDAQGKLHQSIQSEIADLYGECHPAEDIPGFFPTGAFIRQTVLALDFELTCQENVLDVFPLLMEKKAFSKTLGEWIAALPETFRGQIMGMYADESASTSRLKSIFISKSSLGSSLRLALKTGLRQCNECDGADASQAIHEGALSAMEAAFGLDRIDSSILALALCKSQYTAVNGMTDLTDNKGLFLAAGLLGTDPQTVM